MLGPIFTREFLTVPRRDRHFTARVAGLGLLWVIGITAWQATVGFTAALSASPGVLWEAGSERMTLFQMESSLVGFLRSSTRTAVMPGVLGQASRRNPAGDGSLAK